MKIGDGCATVTSYKLPRPLVIMIGKAGARLEARSQDTGLAVLVMVDGRVLNFRLPRARRAAFDWPATGPSIIFKTSSASFSVKEKDEASLSNCFR